MLTVKEETGRRGWDVKNKIVEKALLRTHSGLFLDNVPSLGQVRLDWLGRLG